MKQLAFIIVLLLLPACTQPTANHASPMLRLQLLLTQAASLAALPGSAARQQALELARRAMSGSEMNAMHHGGGAKQPMMKTTHDLGDAIFEWLDSSPPAAAGIQQRIQAHIQQAAQAAQMRLSGTLLGEDTGAFMHSKGQSLQSSFPAVAHDNGAYTKNAAHLFQLLNQLNRSAAEDK